MKKAACIVTVKGHNCGKPAVSANMPLCPKHYAGAQRDLHKSRLVRARAELKSAKEHLKSLLARGPQLKFDCSEPVVK